MKKDIIIKTVTTKANVKGMEIEFQEKIAIDIKTDKEVYVRELEIENDIKLYNLYKIEKGLLTSDQIKNIREKYDLNQNDFSIMLGFGEITIHRYENGTIQTKANDSMITICREPKVFQEIVLKNSSKISKEKYKKLYEKITELVDLKKHKIAEINEETLNGLNHFVSSVSKTTDKLVEIYNRKIEEKSNQLSVELEKITNLTLQKLLYFVQGLSLAFFKQPAFKEEIEAWNYGPVIPEIYHKYKKYGRGEIQESKNVEISKAVEAIIEIVTDYYGSFSSGKLIDITHEERPWKVTIKNQEIRQEIIKEYFEDVYINI